jgi:hypothetical protein
MNFQIAYYYILCILCICILILQVGCERTLPPRPAPPEQDIYPIIEGKYRIYLVNDTIYRVGGSGVDTIARTYYKMEKTAGSIVDQRGRTVSKLEILTGINSTDLAFSELWTQYKDLSVAERVEGNVIYLPLRFPVEKNKTWNGNELNDLSDRPHYRYTNIDTTVQTPAGTFEKCVRVLQRFNSGSITENYNSYEIYAPGVGKIVRFDRFVKYETGTGRSGVSTDSYTYDEILISHNY